MTIVGFVVFVIAILLCSITQVEGPFANYLPVQVNRFNPWGRYTAFEDGLYFLSNYYTGKRVRYEGEWWKSGEHVFQSQKCAAHHIRMQIKNAATPDDAKRIANRNCNENGGLVPGWHGIIKIYAMQDTLDAKFQDDELKRKLDDTYPFYLVEGNWWHDNTWGSCYCRTHILIVGENLLGKMLMFIRCKTWIPYLRQWVKIGAGTCKQFGKKPQQRANQGQRLIPVF